MKSAPQRAEIQLKPEVRSDAMLRAGLACGAVLWAALAALNLILFHDYIYQGYPLSPEVQVTAGKMILDALLCALPGALVAAGAGFALPRGWPHLAGAGAAYLTGLWYGRELVASIYRIDFGTTWAFGEAARELAWHPVWVPALTIGGLAAQIALMHWLASREDRPVTI